MVHHQNLYDEFLIRGKGPPEKEQLDFNDHTESSTDESLNTSSTDPTTTESSIGESHSAASTFLLGELAIEGQSPYILINIGNNGNPRCTSSYDLQDRLDGRISRTLVECFERACAGPRDSE